MARGYLFLRSYMHSTALPTAEYSGASGKYKVAYDDGDEEWVDLKTEKYQWVDRGQERAAKAKAAGG